MPKKKASSSTAAGAKSARKGAAAASTKRQTSKPKSKPRTTGARTAAAKPRAKASAAKAGRAKTPASARAKAKAKPAKTRAKNDAAAKTPTPKPEDTSWPDLAEHHDSEPVEPTQVADADPGAMPALVAEAPGAPASASDTSAEGQDAEGQDAYGPESTGGEGAARPNKLVPTNAVHKTKRRLKRPLHHNRPAMIALAAAVLGVLILIDQAEPPDVSPFEREYAYVDGTPAAPMIGQPPAEAPTAEAPRAAAADASHDDPAVPDDPLRATASADMQAAALSVGPVDAPGLAADELAEMERLLARLDLAPSYADGVVDFETKNAIRLYQEIAGLPVDGEPSEALLEDMREVVKIMDGEG